VFFIYTAMRLNGYISKCRAFLCGRWDTDQGDKLFMAGTLEAIPQPCAGQALTVNGASKIRIVPVRPMAKLKNVKNLPVIESKGKKKYFLWKGRTFSW
jgi:hypothetical protein